MNASAKPALETLESRWVPSSNLNAFARFQSADYPGQDSLTIRVGASDFNSGNRLAIVGIVFRSAADGTVRPTSVANGSTQTIAAKSGLPGTEAGGVTICILKAQAYSLKLPEEVNGPWTVETCLAGDANGDFRVDATDLQVIARRMGKSFGQQGYSREADSNADGVITDSDARLARSNMGVSTTIRPLRLSAGLSSASDPDQNGVVARRQATVVCVATPGANVRIAMEGAPARGFVAGSNGQLALSTSLPAGTSTCKVSAIGSFGQKTTVSHDITVGDTILSWNKTHLQTIRQYKFPSLAGAGQNVSTPPPLAARNLAIMHLTMNEAIRSVESLAASLGRPLANAMADAAASGAAHAVLKVLYPSAAYATRFGNTLSECLSGIPQGRARSEGLAIGREAAARILAGMANDGSESIVNHDPGNQPGEWIPTPPGNRPPLLPQWPGVTPFVVGSLDDLLPPPPPALDSTEYAAALNEVKSLGAATGSSRTPEQTNIALFWADGAGTATPPGHWNQIAADLASVSGRSLAENSRLFATLNVALADAGIACWRAKYTYAFWRPVTAINRASEDGNDATREDTDWRPLLATPPFPSYTSGHSTFSGAAATVLGHFFGEDTPFTTRPDEAANINGSASVALADRAFASFTAAASEASWSRIYGGIHFLFDGEAGLAIGEAVGAMAVEALAG